MTISTEDIQQLRQATGVGIMDAKKALQEAEGDQDKAMEILRKQGHDKAQKRAERATESGIIDTYLHMGKIGAMVMVECETDFVARTDEFQHFAHDIAMHVAAAEPQYISPDDVPESVIEQEKGVYAEEVQDKPEHIQEQVVAGKLDKFYEQVCLYKQPFIKDGEKTIETCLAEQIAQTGENIRITDFSRMELGA
jgi:elongation factor Ts